MPDPTAEQLARESGEAVGNAIADNIQAYFLKLADAVATLQAEQAELRDDLMTIAQRLDAVQGAVAAAQRQNMARRGR